MRVTSIVAQKNNKERYSIFIDGVYSFSADSIDIVKHHIVSDKELTEEELNELIHVCEAAKAFKYVLNLLSKRDYTTNEIQKKLQVKMYNQDVIDITLEKLENLGMINDNKYVERYMNDSINLKRHGKNKIFYDLSQKGIAKEDLSNLVFDSSTEYNNAYYLADKKYQIIKNKPNVKEKLFRYILGKGFDYEIAKKAINAIVDIEEEFIEC